MSLPAAPRNIRKALIGAALETTPGTNVLSSVTVPLANTIFYDVEGLPYGLLDGGERRPDGHYGGQIAAVPTKREARVKFKQEIRNGDAFPTLIQGCGCGTSSPYAPVTTLSAHKALTIKVWEDGVLFAGVGCMGNCKITIEAGMRAMAEWEFLGIWQAVTAVAMPAFSPIVSLTKFLSAATVFTIGGAILPVCEKVEFDLGNPLALRPDLQQVGGNLHARIDPNQRNTTITIDPEAHLIADWDPWAILLAGTTQALALTLSDGTNTFAITAPAVQYREVGKASRGPAAINPITLACCASSGNDDFAITAT